MKQCKQCGASKELSGFRAYYGGRTGHYGYCLVCEGINSREKFLRRKAEAGTAKDVEKVELGNIHRLYELQTTLGFAPPKTHSTSTVKKNLASMLEVFEGLVKAVPAEVTPAQYDARTSDDLDELVKVAPEELVKWLHVPLLDLPEHYQDDIAPDLIKSYRQNHRRVLTEVLARFDEYEDTYAYPITKMEVQ